MKKNNLKKSQSIFEYIMVTIVFTTVGIAGFVAAVHNAAIIRQGTPETHYSNKTDMGKIVNTGKVSQDQQRWPSKMGTYSSDANNYNGTIQSNQVAQPDAEKGYTEGQPRSELYHYEPVNWSVNKELNGAQK